MAQIRGSFFPLIRAALEHRSVWDDVSAQVAKSTSMILESSDPSAWYDEGHAVEIYDLVARTRDLPTVRQIGSDAARLAMKGPWRDMIQVLAGLIGATPRLAFEQIPVLWTSTRREAGEARCVESTSRFVLTEITGFPYTSSPAWNEVWAGHHEALLRHLRFAGQVSIESVSPEAGAIRVRTVWESTPASSK